MGLRTIMTLIVGLNTPHISACTMTSSACPAASPSQWDVHSYEAASHHRLVLNTMISSRGEIMWGGDLISEQQLITYLRRTRRMDPEPYLIVRYQLGVTCDQIVHFRRIFEEYAGCGGAKPCSEVQAR